MKIFQLKKDYKGLFKKGTKFYVISESEFIGVKEFVLRTIDLKETIIVTEDERNKNFKSIS